MLEFLMIPRAALALLASAAWLLASCSRSKPAPPAEASPSARLMASSAPKAAPRGSTTPPTQGSKLPFIEDDYPRALSEARARKLPLFVDAWAPWCHSCLSLREFVLEDPVLAPLGAKFVFAAINTEADQNQPFLAKFPQKNWPTLWVIDPATEKPRVKWVGALTASELTRLLEAVASSDASSTQAAALARLLSGQKSAAALAYAEAIAHYEAALKAAPNDWAERGMVVSALLYQLSLAERYKNCAELAAKEVSSLPAGSAKADAASSGLRCALEALPASKASTLPALMAVVESLLKDSNEAMLADDRSLLHESLVDAFGALGKKKEQEAAVENWAAFLEQEAARATDAEGRAVFDSHRLSAYLTLEQPEKAAAMLVARERELPKDYNPPARLAKAYFEMKKLPEAEAAITRALHLAYGPRKLRLYLLKHEILTALGRPEDARMLLRDAVEFGKGVSTPGGYAKVYEELRGLLGKSEAPPGR